MTRDTTQSLVDDAVELLVKHFGAERVKAALTTASSDAVRGPERQPRNALRRGDLQAKPAVTSLLEELRRKDEEKYRMLATFYAQLKDRTVLPEAHDIRYFAQIIGLKDIHGKSRKDMVPKLMQFLFEQPTERLRVDLEAAPDVSEQQRQKGFSIITDKLLGHKPETQ